MHRHKHACATCEHALPIAATIIYIRGGGGGGGRRDFHICATCSYYSMSAIYYSMYGHNTVHESRNVQLL